MSILEKVIVAAENIDLNNIENFSIDRQMAIGIGENSPGKNCVWVILDFSKNPLKILNIFDREYIEDPVDELKVSIVVLGSNEAWASIGAGGKEAVIDAADQRRIAVSGKLAYFIRNVRSTVDLIAEFSRSYSDSKFD